MSSTSTTAPPKIGLLVPQSGIGERWTRWTEALDFARRAENLGFDSLWLIDHLLIRQDRLAQQHGEAPPPLATELAAVPPVGVWECWSWLAALAAGTSRIALGQLVTCVGYRNPALLAKMADTVDEISGGRLILGLGAGDYEDEHRSFGVPFEGRVGRFEEALTIIHGLLRDGAVDFEGQHYSARECELRPRGPRPQGPPLLIGAVAGRPRMLRLTVEHADMWNAWLAFGKSVPDAIPPAREAVDAACRKHGRDPQTLERTVTVAVTAPDRRMPYPDALPISGTPEQVAEAFRAFAREGITHIQVWLAPMRPAAIEWLAEAVELLRATPGQG
jgi:alkanesulfonate monooxygenase SsuD/methylene tetrahydromethanopterin reductase-like flavin-dependent oxidoreductase (luciferase family)